MQKTDNDLITFLVTRVLGWTVGDHPEKHGTGQWYCEYGEDVYFTDKHGNFICSSNFNPLDEFSDCETLLDKIEADGWWWDWCTSETHKDSYWFGLGKSGLLFDAYVGLGKSGLLFDAYGSTRTEPICLAIARAYGWKEDA